MSELISGDLRDEEYREYVLESGKVYRIVAPQTLWVRMGGNTHRVLDSEGVVHCVPGPGYRNAVLRWKPKSGTDPVAF